MFILFATPFTPQEPCYVVMGIVITASATGKEGFSVPVAIALATLITYSMLLTVPLFNSSVGRVLGTSATVRRLVGVHTIEIRALEIVLREPGLSVPKTCLLLGVPNWPVAVLCGMLRVSVLEVIIGMSPV